MPFNKEQKSKGTIYDFSNEPEVIVGNQTTKKLKGKSLKDQKKELKPKPSKLKAHKVTSYDFSDTPEVITAGPVTSYDFSDEPEVIPAGPVTSYDFSENPEVITGSPYGIAMSYNKSQNYSPELWMKIQEIIGAKPDGIPGQETAKKVKKWQKSNGIKADGKVGPETLRAMGLSLSPGKEQPGDFVSPSSEDKKLA